MCPARWARRALSAFFFFHLRNAVSKIIELEVADYFSKKLGEPVFVPVGCFTPFDGISQSKKSSFEVKFEQQAAETGNLCIEYSCRGRPSGLAATQASAWIHCLPLNCERITCFQFDVEWLRETLALFPLLSGGDNKLSRFKLLPVHLAEKLKQDKFTISIDWKEWKPYWGERGKYEGRR